MYMKQHSVWQGVAMDSLKFYPDLPCPMAILPCPAGGPLEGWPLEGWPAVVFYPFGLPTSYAYVKSGNEEKAMFFVYFMVEVGENIPEGIFRFQYLWR
jgi:hypothetical protein